MRAAVAAMCLLPGASAYLGDPTGATTPDGWFRPCSTGTDGLTMFNGWTISTRDLKHGDLPGARYLAALPTFGKNSSYAVPMMQKFKNADIYGDTWKTRGATDNGTVTLTLYNINNPSATVAFTVRDLCHWRPAKDWTLNSAVVNKYAGCTAARPSTKEQCYGQSSFDQSSPSSGCNCPGVAGLNSNNVAVVPVWWPAMPNNGALWQTVVDAAIFQIYGSAGTGGSSSSQLAAAANTETLLMDDPGHVTRLFYNNTVNYVWKYDSVEGKFTASSTEDVPASSSYDPYLRDEQILRADRDNGQWCGPRRQAFYDVASSLSDLTKNWLYARNEFTCNDLTAQNAPRTWTFDELHGFLGDWTTNGHVVTVRGNDTEIPILTTFIDTSQLSGGSVASANTAAAAIRVQMDAISTANADYRTNATLAAQYDALLAQVIELETAGRWVLVRDTRAMAQGRLDSPNWANPTTSADCNYLDTTLQTSLNTAAQAFESTYTLPCNTGTFAVGNTLTSRYTDWTVRGVSASGDASARISSSFEIASTSTATVTSTTVGCGTINRMASLTTFTATAETCLNLQNTNNAANDNSFTEQRLYNNDRYYHSDDFVTSGTTKITSNTVRWVPWSTVLKSTGYDVLQSVTVSKKSMMVNKPELSLNAQCSWVGAGEGNWPYTYIDVSWGAVHPRTRIGDTAVGDWRQEKRYNPSRLSTERVQHDRNLCVSNCEAPSILGASASQVRMSGDQTGCLTSTWRGYSRRDTQPSRLSSYFTSETCRDLAEDVTVAFDDCWSSKGRYWSYNEPNLAALYLADIGWDTVAAVENARKFTKAQMMSLCQCKFMPRLVSKHNELISKCADDARFINGGLKSRATLVNISALVTQLDFGCQRDLAAEIFRPATADASEKAGYCYAQDTGSTVTLSTQNASAYEWVPPAGCRCKADTGPLVGAKTAQCTDGWNTLITAGPGGAGPVTLGVYQPGCYVEDDDSCASATTSDINQTSQNRTVNYVLCDRVPKSLLETKTLQQWKDLVTVKGTGFRIVVSQPPPQPSIVDVAHGGSLTSRVLSKPWRLWATPTRQYADSSGVDDSPVDRNDIELTLPIGTSFSTLTNVDRLRWTSGNFSSPIILGFTIPDDDVFLSEWTYKQMKTATVDLCRAAQFSTSCCMRSEIAAYRRIAAMSYGFTARSGNRDKMTVLAEAFIARCRVLGVVVDGGAVGLDAGWQNDKCVPVWDDEEDNDVTCGTGCIAGLATSLPILGIVVILFATGFLSGAPKGAETLPDEAA